MSQYYNYKTGVFILLMSLVAYLILIIGFYYNDALMGHTPQAARYIVLGFFELLLLLPVLFYVVGNGKSVKHAFRLKPVSWRSLRDIVFVAVGLFFLVELVQTMTNAVFNAEPAQIADIKAMYPLNFILILLVSGVIAPIVEEAVFRGYLLRVMLRSRFTPLVAILVTSAFFALSHLSYQNLPGIFIAGIILGYIAYSFYSIIPGIIIHGLFNIMVLVDVNLPQIREQIFYARAFVPWVLLAGGLLLLAVGLWNIKHKVVIHRRRRDSNEEGVGDEK
ncbi:MAG: CPBP family intramembrane metalloprotease [Candidatus Marinimicrobia bacterium]|nr:CPBP family intramembrane metalloprotease [Candidatus Neomarinimicrobiota bacterium]